MNGRMLAMRRVTAGYMACSWMVNGGVARKVLARAMASTSDQDLRVEMLEGDLKCITIFALNRPAVKNAIGVNLLSCLEEGCKMVRHNREVRAVILKSDVPGVFCAGADLKERAAMTEEEVTKHTLRQRRIVSDLAELPMPVIAAMDGVAVGGGLEIALACDIRVAADGAKMGLVETRLALIPGAGGTQRLPRLVGIGKAKEMIFTARVVTGEEAVDMGLVEHLAFQNDDSNAAYLKALDIAKEIRDKGPVAITMAKQAINHGMQIDLNTGMKVEEACYAQVIPTEDRVEALKAFKEKRKPNFKGK